MITPTRPPYHNVGLTQYYDPVNRENRHLAQCESEKCTWWCESSNKATVQVARLNHIKYPNLT